MLSTAQSRHLGAERIDQWPVLSERGELRAARRRMPRSYAPGSRRLSPRGGPPRCRRRTSRCATAIPASNWTGGRSRRCC